MTGFLANAGEALKAMANDVFTRRKAHITTWHPANKGLIAAIGENDAEAVKTALAKGANPNCYITDKWKSGNPLIGNTSKEVPALIYAIDKGARVEVLQALIGGGADLQARVLESDIMPGFGRGPALVAAAESKNKEKFFTILNASEKHDGVTWDKIFKQLQGFADPDPVKGLPEFKVLLAETVKHPQAREAFIEAYAVSFVLHGSTYNTPGGKLYADTVVALANTLKAGTPAPSAAPPEQAAPAEGSIRVPRPLSFKKRP